MLKNKLESILIEFLRESGFLTADIQSDLLKLEIPPNLEWGDLSLPCFGLAKIKKKSPVEVAEEVAVLLRSEKAQKDGLSDKVIEVKAMGPYVNLKLKSKFSFGEIYNDVFAKKTVAGATLAGKKREQVMLEYLSPNTNKPLHLGHLRNGVLGMSLANILEARGEDVLKTTLINDRGVHICKSMLAWKKFGNGDTPISTGVKGDHFVGDYYVKFAQEAEVNPELGEEAQLMLKKWEEGDEKVRKIWQRMNDWVWDGFKKTFKVFGFKFDVIYKESETYRLGKDIVLEGLRKGIFQKDAKGAVIFVLPREFGLDENGQRKRVTLLRADGTSVYLTQDLGTAVKRMNDFVLDKMIYVVASEQNYHFKVLFAVLKALGYTWANKLFHLSYEMVYLPEGKMKSREGKVVDADDLLEEVKNLAKKGLLERHSEKKLSEKEAEKRSLKIALAAIKFYLLRVNPSQTINFNPEESLSFEGFTGPYCQYAYARGSKLLRDGGVDLKEKLETDFSQLGSRSERALLMLIARREEKIKMAEEDFNPAVLANYAFELAKAFNHFYHQESILKAETGLKKARLALVQTFLLTLEEVLSLLGIEVLAEM